MKIVRFVNTIRAAIVDGLSDSVLVEGEPIILPVNSSGDIFAVFEIVEVKEDEKKKDGSRG